MQFATWTGKIASQIISVSFKISSVKVNQDLRGSVFYFSNMDNQIQAKMDPDEEIEGFRVVVQSLGITHHFRRFERKFFLFCICPLKMCFFFSAAWRQIHFWYCRHSSCRGEPCSNVKSNFAPEIRNRRWFKEVLQREIQGLKVYPVYRSYVFSMTGTYFWLIFKAIRLYFYKNAWGQYALLLSLLLCTVTFLRFST